MCHKGILKLHRHVFSFCHSTVCRLFAQSVQMPGKLEYQEIFSICLTFNDQLLIRVDEIFSTFLSFAETCQHDNYFQLASGWNKNRSTVPYCTILISHWTRRLFVVMQDHCNSFTQIKRPLTNVILVYTINWHDQSYWTREMVGVRCSSFFTCKYFSSVECPAPVSNRIFMFLENMPKFDHLFSSESTPARYCKIHWQNDLTPNKELDSDGILRDWRVSSTRIDNNQSHGILTRINTVHPLWSPFMNMEAREHVFFRVNGTFLPLFSYGEALKGRTFIFNEDYKEHFVTQSVLKMLFSSLQCQSSAKLVNVTYETALRCE